MLLICLSKRRVAHRLGTQLLCSLSSEFLCVLHNESLVDVGNDTTTSNGGLDQGIELFISTDSQLQVSGSYALDLQVFGCVAGQLEDLGGEVLKDSGGVDSRGGSYTRVCGNSCLQESVNSSHGELHHEEVNDHCSLLSK